MQDIYDSRTPKYSTANDIYEKLCKIYYNEEASILSEMFPDVSYDNQDYYYTDKGYKLKEKFEELSGYGNKIWLMDLAIFQLSQEYWQVHDFIFQCLNNTDLAKRIGFKQIFVEQMLRGSSIWYNEIVEEYAAELRELNRFVNVEMINAYKRVCEERGWRTYVTPYPNFSYALYKKIMGLQLQEYTQLIAECRAHLTAYDDFLHGLRMNQALYNYQEKMYGQRVSALEASYEEKYKRLLAIAESQGLLVDFENETKLLEGGSEDA